MLTWFSHVLVLFVALEHLWFLVLEMFIWQRPVGRKTFLMTEAKAKATADLAANQGLYNGFLAVGLLVSFFVAPEIATAFRIYFLFCVFIAGVFGGFTVSRRIFFIQGLPALAALAVDLVRYIL